MARSSRYGRRMGPRVLPVCMSQKPSRRAGNAGIAAIKLAGISAPLVDFRTSVNAGGVNSAAA